MFNIKDFATGIVVTAPSPSNSGLTLTLQTGEGARMPAVPFSATAHPPTEMPTLDNAERILVTNVTGDTLTIVRAQGNTTAKDIAVGWRISNALFKDNLDEFALAEDMHDAVTITGEDYLSITGQAITTNPIDLDNLSATGTPSSNTYLRGDNSWAEITAGSGGYAANVYLRSTNSTVPTYKNLSYTNDISSTEYSGVTNNNEVLLNTYLFEAPSGISTIDAGIWSFTTHSKLSSTNGVSYIKVIVFKRTSGGTETDLFTMTSDDIASTSYVVKTLQSYQDSFTINTTDYLGARVYVGTNSLANVTVYYSIGDGTPSFFNTPLALRHTQLRGLNDDTNNLHVTSTEKSTWSAKQDALGFTPENVANKDTATTLGTSDTKYPSQKAVKTYVDSLSNLTQVRGETPSGLVNGSNTTFTLAATPATGSERLYKNTGRMRSGVGNDYTISGNTITMTTAPATGTVLLVDYEVSSGTFAQGLNNFLPPAVPTGLVNSSNTVFTCASSYIGGTLQVYINGILQAPTTHYTETTPSTGVFTMSDAPSTGDNILVVYQHTLSSTGSADTVDGFHASATPTASTILPLDSNGKLTESTFPTQQAWQSPTLQNSWVNYGSGYATAGYMKDSLGFVHIKGAVKSGTTTPGTVIFTLPVGYRPAEHSYITVGIAPNALGLITINSDGTVQAVSVSATYTMMGQTIFKAEG